MPWKKSSTKGMEKKTFYSTFFTVLFGPALLVTVLQSIILCDRIAIKWNYAVDLCAIE